MLGFTPDFSHAFYKAGICTQLDIMYIIFTTYFYICLTGDRTWSMPLGMVCSRELHYLAITSSAQTTWRDFYGSPSSQAWGLDSAKLLDIVSYEDWIQEKFHTMCYDFLILNFKSWNLDSRLRGCGARVIDDLFFKFLEDKDQEIEDWFDPQPDSAIQPKAQRLLHMEREFIAHHIKEDDSGLEHLIALKQPKKYSKD